MKTSLKHRENVHVRKWKVKEGEVITLLLASDLHLDNPKCDRKKVKKDFDEAVKRGARILLNGDTLCLMQGKYDKRSSKSDVRPEHKVSNYLDAVVDTSIDFLLPYAQHIDFIGQGNHETAIKRRHETDILKRLVDGLNHRAGTDIGLGGYGGFYITHINLLGHKIFSHKIKYFHGSGGGGPVTKGAIQFNRIKTMCEGADLYWLGHVHESMEAVYTVEYLTAQNRIKLKDILMVRTPTYKEEYVNGKGGWHVERGAPPKPIGGRFLEISATSRGGIKQRTYKT